MSYEPYRPGPPDPDPENTELEDTEPEGAEREGTEPEDTEPEAPSYESYPAPPPPPPVATPPARSWTPPTAPPPLYRGGRSSSGVGVLVGLALGAVVVVGVIAAGQSSSDGTRTDTYSSCASDHDEDESLFSDEEWCDLELMGGNGNGLADEGGDGGPVEENDLFGDRVDDDPFGPP